METIKCERCNRIKKIIYTNTEMCGCTEPQEKEIERLLQENKELKEKIEKLKTP